MSTALDVLRVPLDGIRLVEASAGTGKTWAICGLYLRLLLERRLPVEQILVVTFTNAATAELRERIRARLAELLATLAGGAAPADGFIDALIEGCVERGLEPGELHSRVELALQSFDQAAIHTIHGFCQRALADAPFTARLPLALELVPDDSQLVAEVVADFWRRRLGGEAVSAGLVGLLEARRDAPARWAQLLRRHLGRPLARSIWPDGIDDASPADAALRAAQLTEARTLWQAERAAIVASIEGSTALNRTRYNDAAAATGAREWDALLDAADPLALSLPRDKAQLYRRSLLEKSTRVGQVTPRHAFFDLAEALLAEDERLGRALELQRLRLLRELLDAGSRALRERKRALRLISFDDMLGQLHERLASGDCPELAAALRARFPAALIDEFQDTDPLQWAIFEAIYATPSPAEALSLFLVGDPKQAIYSFRNADLHTYLQARSRTEARYSLTDNQRSTEDLITALNGLFESNRQAFRLPGLDYRQVRYGAKPRKPWVDAGDSGAALKVWLLPGADDQLLTKKAAAAAAVAATAGEIVRLLGEAAAGRLLIDGRPVGAGDMAVLVRTHAQGLAMRGALAAVGLGCVELSQTSVYATPEAEALERLLAAILEPGHGGLLRAAFATELLGDDAARTESLADDEALLTARIERFAGYRDTWLRRGVGPMLRELSRAEGIERRLLPRRDGERRLTNLRHLAELLQQAAETQRAPHALLRWLRAQRRSEAVDEVAQMRLESDRHLVQIVTIHRSKGLEYPLVFCPFLYDGRLPPADEGPDGRVTRGEDDQVVIDWRGRFLDRREADALRQQRRDEDSAEQMRLVYVALTRAVYRCHVVAGAYATGRNSVTESLRSPLTWLVAGDGVEPAAWPPAHFGVAALEQSWRALADRVGPALSVTPLPAPAAAHAARPATSPQLAALPPPREIPAGWRIGSYSALLRGGERAGDAPPEPQPVKRRSRRSAPTGRHDDILDFPRGTEAGDCLHAVLQGIDFCDRSGWPAAIDAALQAHPLAAARRRAPPEAAARWPAMIARLLDDLSRTELVPGLRLDTVAPARRLAELEFTLPSHGLDSGALQRLLEGAGYALPPLGAATLDGYLNGAIDLVFEHAGRFYLIDWKSNHLGDSPAEYRGAALDDAMAEHGYHLQQLIYSVALQRLLQRRLAAYDFERDFGGVLYLFLRGVRAAAGDAPSGVWFHRPRAETLEALDALLEGRLPRLAAGAPPASEQIELGF